MKLTFKYFYLAFILALIASCNSTSPELSVPNYNCSSFDFLINDKAILKSCKYLGTPLKDDVNKVAVVDKDDIRIKLQNAIAAKTYYVFHNDDSSYQKMESTNFSIASPEDLGFNKITICDSKEKNECVTKFLMLTNEVKSIASKQENKVSETKSDEIAEEPTSTNYQVESNVVYTKPQESDYRPSAESQRVQNEPSDSWQPIEKNPSVVREVEPEVVEVQPEEREYEIVQETSPQEDVRQEPIEEIVETAPAPVVDPPKKDPIPKPNPNKGNEFFNSSKILTVDPLCVNRINSYGKTKFELKLTALNELELTSCKVYSNQNWTGDIQLLNSNRKILAMLKNEQIIDGITEIDLFGLYYVLEENETYILRLLPERNGPELSKVRGCIKNESSDQISLKRNYGDIFFFDLKYKY